MNQCCMQYHMLLNILCAFICYKGDICKQRSDIECHKAISVPRFVGQTSANVDSSCLSVQVIVLGQVGKFFILYNIDTTFYYQYLSYIPLYIINYKWQLNHCLNMVYFLAGKCFKVNFWRENVRHTYYSIYCWI